MPSGGSRARSGPPKDPQALRRDRPSDRNGWKTLPSEGRNGDVPFWPLSPETPREAQLWAQLWTTPQAVAWEAMQVETEVALYARRLAEGELPGAPVALGTLLRQMQESLGLSVTGLARNQWRIAIDETAPAGEDRSEAPASSSASSSRSRFKVVPHAAGE